MLLPLEEVSWLSVGTGLLFALFAFTITKTIRQHQWKLQSLGFGFFLVGIWGLFETVDEFIIAGPLKELVFNDLGRVVLIFGLFLLINEFDRLLGAKNANK